LAQERPVKVELLVRLLPTAMKSEQSDAIQEAVVEFAALVSEGPLPQVQLDMLWGGLAPAFDPKSIGSTLSYVIRKIDASRLGIFFKILAIKIPDWGERRSDIAWSIWKDHLHANAAQSREMMYSVLRSVVPVSFALAGGETAKEILAGMECVARWWA